METVCHDKHWDVALAHNDDGGIIGAMPYLIGSKAGLRYIVQPQLTQYNGPWYKSDDIDWRRNADIQLRAHLQSLHPILFQQNFAPGLTASEGWEDYTVTPRVTYRLEDISDPQFVFDRFDKSRRQRQIRRAEKSLFADPDITPAQFARFHADYWRSRGRKDLLSQEFMERVINAALQRKQGKLLALRDGEGTLQAARFVAFDDNCAYALLSALHPQHPNGASALLFWLILQQLSGQCHSFDFEGSMDPDIAFSYSLYGAQPTTYYQLTRCTIPLLRKLLKL
jgi:hypothetical protein